MIKLNAFKSGSKNSCLNACGGLLFYRQHYDFYSIYSELPSDLDFVCGAIYLLGAWWIRHKMHRYLIIPRYIDN